MPFKAPDPKVVAELITVVGNLPGLELKHRHLGGGVEMITVAWPGREVVLEKLFDEPVWNAYDARLDDPIGTGVTPTDALRAALGRA